MHTAWEVSRGWTFWEALSQELIGCSCSDEMSYNQRLLAPQTSLSTKASQPSCLLPASWSRAAAGPTSLRTGDPWVWWGPGQGGLPGGTSSPLPPASWHQLFSLGKPVYTVLRASAGVYCHSNWSSISRGAQGAWGVIWWVGSTISISLNDYVTTRSSSLWMMHFSTHSSQGGLFSIPCQVEPGTNLRVEIQISPMQGCWQQRLCLPYHCMEVPLRGACWGLRRGVTGAATTEVGTSSSPYTWQCFLKKSPDQKLKTKDGHQTPHQSAHHGTTEKWRNVLWDWIPTYQHILLIFWDKFTFTVCILFYIFFCYHLF